MAGDIKALLVRITGRVQGVGFRDWTQRQAMQLGLTGWVRNEADGSVAALIVGPDAAVAAMAERFWQGPRFSSVTDVRTEAIEVVEVPGDFRITR
jgi:acylphosphatase